MDIKLKTLLLYPSDGELNKKYSYPKISLGIATLIGFLNSNGYKNIKNIYFDKKSPYYFRLVKRLANLLGIRGYLLKYDCKTKVDSESEMDFSIRALINKEQPDLVGFSIMSHGHLYNAFHIAKIIKSFNRKIATVFGGPIITKNISYFLNNKFLTKIVDYFVVGHGEEPLFKLIKTLESLKDFDSVPNLYYKTDRGYKRSKRSFESGIEYLKVIPYFDESILKDYACDSLPLRVSLGCYWGKCAFCTYRLMNKGYVLLDPDDILKIMKTLIKKHNIRSFSFLDDSFSPIFLKRFSEKVIKENLKISWSTLACLDRAFTDPSIPRLLRKAGCKYVRFGLESFSPRVLELMRKMQKPDYIPEIVKFFKKAGLKGEFTAMFGFPTETRQEAMETLSFLNNNKRFFHPIVQEFVLEENTIVYDKPDKFGIKKIYKDNKMSGARGGFKYDVKEGMSQEEAKLFTMHAREVLKGRRGITDI
ncbi:MAG: radical SAM protein [Deltaproteobacteria bacterium]|nr:radical SAM protein [Deltaproteobacteria bacterium]